MGRTCFRYKKGHPVKFMVETTEDLKTYRNFWLDSVYEENTQGCNETYTRLDREIGEHGVYIPTVRASPVQYLLEYVMGMENFY